MIGGSGVRRWVSMAVDGMERRSPEFERLVTVGGIGRRPELRKGSTTRKSVPELDQLGELPLLFRDPVRGPLFIFSARVRSGLLDQLIYILPYHGNELIKVRNRASSHSSFSRVGDVQLSRDSTTSQRLDEGRLGRAISMPKTLGNVRLSFPATDRAPYGLLS